MMRWPAALLFALVALSSPLRAAPVSFGYTGEVTSVGAGLTPALYGATFTAVFDFDTTATPSTNGLIFGASARVVFAGGYTANSTGVSLRNVLAARIGVPPSDPPNASSVTFFGGVPLQAAADNGLSPFAFNLALVGPLGYVAADAVPGTPPPVAGATLDRLFSFGFLTQEGTLSTVSGRVTGALAQAEPRAVPAPAGGFLLGFALLGLAAVRGARRPR
jgi:hypothetical protein